MQADKTELIVRPLTQIQKKARDMIGRYCDYFFFLPETTTTISPFTFACPEKYCCKAAN